MGRTKSIVAGESFGDLIVLYVEDSAGSGHHAIAVCKCICGKTHKAQSHLLKRGSIKSCGCKKIENIKKALKNRPKESYSSLPYGEASFNALLGQYKKSAKRTNRKFSLTKIEFRRITSSKCSYCGVPPSSIKNWSSKGKTYNGPYIYNGIDRIDNKKGYIKNNVQPCCFICNNAKRAMSDNEFKEWIKRLVLNNF